MNCQEARSFVEDALDRSLSGRVKRRLDLHLQHCKECRDFFEAERVEFVRWYRAVNCDCGHSHSLPTDFADRLVAAVMAPRPLPFFLRMPRWALVAASIAIMFMGAVFAGVVVEHVISSAKEEAATSDVPESEAPQETQVADTGVGDSCVPQNSFFEEVAESGQTDIAEVISTTKTEASNNTPSASTQENGENDKMSIRKTISAIAAAFTFATGSAQATDAWTVSENFTLTEDMSVGALTVNSGVTLDLNGYKLTCTSLDGSGTITSTGEDAGLTKKATEGGTFTKASPSGDLAKGTVTNLFSNNTYYQWDDTHRILLDKTTLPLRVDYDFGAGTAKVVSAYNLWCATKGRAPKEWVLYGSNADVAYGSASDDDWVEVDSRSDETGWTHEGNKNSDAECRSYECDNTTAYRYYRLKVIENNGDAKHLEMVQLEYFNTNPGELHLNVASGSATWPASITFTGNIKVVKEGTGTLESFGELNMNGATFVIAAGTIQSAGTFRLAQTTSDKAVNVEVAEGGTLHSGGILAIGCGKNATLTVNGGTVYSGDVLRVGNNANSTATLNLNSGMVKASKVYVASGGSGTLNFNGGTLQATADNNSFISSTLAVVNVLSGGGTIDANGKSVKIEKTLTGEGAITFKGGGTVTLSGANDYTGGTTIELGTKVVTSNETAKNTILDGLTIDGKAYFTTTDDVEVFQCSSALTDPDDLANVTLENCGTGSARKISGSKILVDFVAAPWATIGANTTWSTLVADNGEPPADRPVIIDVTAACTLGIDTDVTVAGLAFTGTGASSSTLSIAEGKTLTTEDVSGIGNILNNGTIVKTGDGTATWPFDNDSTGTTTVSAGILKAQANAANSETNQTVRVKSGATFDVNGYKVYANVILEGGARFMNSRANLNYNTDQTVSITLEGDATVTALYDCGLIQYNNSPTALNLGAHTLTLDGSATFRLSNTTITGTGTINVTSGTLTIKSGHAVTGADCTLTMGSGTTLTLGDHLSVSNFTNSGTISNNGTLTVTGTLTPGNEIPRLTLADGSTVKASASQAQTVSTIFTAIGSYTIDASEITKEQLSAAVEQRIPVLTVPTANRGGDWTVANPPAASIRAKWVNNGDDISTLYLCKSQGTVFIIR